MSEDFKKNNDEKLYNQESDQQIEIEEELVFNDDDKSSSMSYRMTNKAIEFFKEVMKEKDLKPKEFFNLVATELQKNQILENTSGISSELRRNFDTDVSRLRAATDSIMFLFMNQMKNIMVEKDNWLQEKDSILVRIKVLKEDLSNSENTIQSLTNELQDRNFEIDKLQNDLIDKIADKESVIKTKDERIADKEEKITNLTSDLATLKATFNEEKNNLNNRIVELLNDIKQFEPIKLEKEKLEKELTSHKENVEKLKERLEYYKDKHKSEMNNLVAKHEVEVKTAMVDTESRIRNELNTALEEYRSENKALYARMDKLREDHSDISKENALLKEERMKLVNENELLKKEIEQLRKNK